MKTIKNIPIMHTGDFYLSTGEINFTKKHLAAAVAAVADPSVKEPRLGVGHMDGRLDGEPAFGKFTNLNLQNDGHWLYGDLVGVPDWLAEDDVMACAYPNRSVEGTFGYQGMPGSPIHEFALTRVVLLGVEMPGISTLEDLKVQLTGEPEYTLLDEEEMLEVAASSFYNVATYMNGEPVTTKNKNVAAAISVDDVRREFYQQVSTGDRSNWWANEIQVDPQQVIVNDEATGDTFRVAYASAGDGKVKFSDPVKVEVVYQDVAASGRKPIPVGTGTVYATAADSRPEERGDMSKKKAIRAALGLAEDATEAQVKAAMAEAEGDEDDGDEDDADDDETADEDDDAAEVEVPEAVAAKRTVKVKASTAKRVKAAGAKNTDGTVTVDAETFATMQSTLNVLASAQAKSETDRQDEVVGKAIAAGKIPPARKDFWVKAMRADPEGTTATLDEMASIIPIQAIGSGQYDVGDQDDTAADPIYAMTAGRSIAASGRKPSDPFDPFLKVGTVQREV